MTDTRACSCAKCAELCTRNPGWFTPTEAREAISAGYAPKMMRDWLEPDTHFGNDVRIYVLAAASEDHEGADAPEGNLLEIALLGDWCKGQCVLLKDGLCTIHSSGFKPLQCRTAMGCEEDPDYVDNYTIAALWDTDEGHEVLALWERFK